MSVVSPARRQRLEPDERRAQILAAARRLFSKSGYSAVSATDIAREAGVARGLINHYFGSKRELYLAVVRKMMVVPAAATENLPRTTIEQRLAISVDRFLDVVERNKDMWLAAIGPEAIGRDGDVDEIVREADEIAADRVLEAAMMTGDFEGQELLRAMIRSFGSMVRAASHEWLVHGTLTRTDLHVMLTDTILHLLKEGFPAVYKARQAE